MVFNKKPPLNKIKVFGCDGYAFTEEINRAKLEPTAQLVCYVGVNLSQNSCSVLEPFTMRIKSTKNVRFRQPSFQVSRYLNNLITKKELLSQKKEEVTEEEKEEEEKKEEEEVEHEKEEYYEVERITDYRIDRRTGKEYYLVKFEGMHNQNG